MLFTYLVVAGACSFSDGITMMPMLDAIVKSSGLTQVPGTQSFTVVSPTLLL